MRRLRLAAAVGLVLLAWPWAAAQAGHGGLFLGFNFGVPLFYPACYYRPYPVVVAPAPVVYQAAPVIYQAAPAPQPACPAPAPRPTCGTAPVPTIQQTAAPPLAVDGGQNPVSWNLQRLADPDDRVRAEAAIQLGREKADRAADPLAATLAGDRSPQVRETAARALGLIGAPRALPALCRAALADSDPTVRHTAEFAAEVVQSQQRP